MPTPDIDPILVDLEERAHAAGRTHERLLAIAWIRDHASRLPAHKQLAISHIADEIERGSHTTSGTCRSIDRLMDLLPSL